MAVLRDVLMNFSTVVGKMTPARGPVRALKLLHGGLLRFFRLPVAAEDYF